MSGLKNMAGELLFFNIGIGGAPIDAAYALVSSINASGLTQKRIIASDGTIDIADGGAGGNLTWGVHGGLFVDHSADGNASYCDPIGGNDANPGTVTHQVQTVARLNAVLAAKVGVTVNNRAVAYIDPALLPSGTTWNILPNVCYEGPAPNDLRTDSAGTVQLDPAAWAAAQDNRVILKGMSLRGTVNIDFLNKPQGKIYMMWVGSNNVVTVTGFDGINQSQFFECFFFAGLTVKGFNMNLYRCDCINGSNLTINSDDSGRNGSTIVVCKASTIEGNVVINYLSGHGPAPITVDLRGSVVLGNITATCNGGSAAGSITLYLPDTYGTLTITGPAGSTTLPDNHVTSGSIVSGNGTNKVNFFTAPPGTVQQYATSDGAGNGFYDYARAWFLTVAGGGQASIVTDPSSFVVGNVLQITSLSGPQANVAFQPPINNFVSMATQIVDNFNTNYNTSLGNLALPMLLMSGGLAAAKTYTVDPLSRFTTNPAQMGAIQLVTVGTQSVEFEFSGQIYYGFGSSTDTRATYILKIYNGGGSILSLVQFNGACLANTAFTPQTQYFNLSSFTTVQFGATVDLYRVVLEVSGGDDAVHNLVFQNVNYKIKVYN